MGEGVGSQVDAVLAPSGKRVALGPSNMLRVLELERASASLWGGGDRRGHGKNGEEEPRTGVGGALYHSLYEGDGQRSKTRAAPIDKEYNDLSSLRRKRRWRDETARAKEGEPGMKRGGMRMQ